MKQLIELLKQQANINSQIRAQRVQLIRQAMARTKKSLINRELKRIVDEMERRLERVHFCHSEFDELLELIEDHLAK